MMTKWPSLSLLVSLGVLGMAACERKEEKSGTQAAPAAPQPPAAEAGATPPAGSAEALPERDPRHAKIEAKLRQLVADRLKVPLERVVPEAQLKRDLGVDDLKFIELVMAMEEEFNLTITDEYADKIKTVGDAVKILIWLGAR